METNNPHNYTPARTVRNIEDWPMVNWQGCINILRIHGIVLYHEVGDTLDDGGTVPAEHLNERPTWELEDFFYTVYREWSKEDIIKGVADVWIDARHVFLWLDLPVDEFGEIEQHEDIPYVFGEHTKTRRNPYRLPVPSPWGEKIDEATHRLKWLKLAPLNVMRCRLFRCRNTGRNNSQQVILLQRRRRNNRCSKRRQRQVTRLEERICKLRDDAQYFKRKQAEAAKARETWLRNLGRAQVFQIPRCADLGAEYAIFCATKERAFDLVEIREYSKDSIHGVRWERITWKTEEEAQQEADRLNAEGVDVNRSEWLGQETSEEHRAQQMMNDHGDPWARWQGITG